MRSSAARTARDPLVVHRAGDRDQDHHAGALLCLDSTDAGDNPDLR